MPHSWIGLRLFNDNSRPSGHISRCLIPETWFISALGPYDRVSLQVHVNASWDCAMSVRNSGNLLPSTCNVWNPDWGTHQAWGWRSVEWVVTFSEGDTPSFRLLRYMLWFCLNFQHLESLTISIILFIFCWVSLQPPSPNFQHLDDLFAHQIWLRSFYSDLVMFHFKLNMVHPYWF